MECRYLTVDCELSSRADLSELASYLEERLFLVTFQVVDGISFICVESGLIHTSGPSDDFDKFFSIFSGLPNFHKEKILSCDTKIMDVGLMSGTDGNALAVNIPNDSLITITNMGFDLYVTLYPLAS